MPRFFSNQMHPVKTDQIFGKKFIIFLLLVLYCLIPSTLAAEEALKPDTLLLKLENTTSSDERAELMLSIAREYYYANVHEAIRYAKQANEQFKQLNNTRGIGQSLNILGAGYFAMGDYAAAEKSFLSALHTARLLKDSIQIANLLNNLAGIQLKTGRLEQAIENYQEAGKIFKEKDNPDGAIAIENSISSIYRNIGSYRNAHTHLRNALSIAEEHNIIRLLGAVYYNLGALFLEEGKFDEAMEFSLKSYSLRVEEGQISGQIKCLINLGSIFHETNKQFESDSCYTKALFLAEKYEFAEDEANILLHLGYQDIQDNKYQNATELLSRGIKLADYLGDAELKIQLHEYMFYVDSAQGNLEGALLHLQQSDKLKSEIQLSDVERKLSDLENLFSLAKIENSIKEEKIQRNKTLIIGLLAGLIVSILITVLIIQQVILRSQKKIAELSQENLRSQMNPHFIFNILNSIHTFLLSNDPESSGKYLLKFSNLLRLTLDNSRSKKVSIHDELDALRLYLDLESMRFNNQLEYEIIVDDEIDPLMFKIPTFLLQPYVENSIVHGLQNKQGKGKIEIRLDYQDKGIHCCIQDNGIGRKKAADIKQKKGINYKSHGCKITETRIKLLNKMYGRKFSVMYTDLLDKDENCKGTKVEFNLPVLN